MPILDPDTIVKRQIECEEPTVVECGDHAHTLLTPARSVPMPDDPGMRLSLDGDWRVCRWPFEGAEEDLVGLDVADGLWERLCQPGKVFYADPDEDGHGVPDWNRVTLDHVDPEDGAVLRRRIVVPPLWAGRRIRVRFDGIYPGGRIYANGQLLGEHLSGLTPAEFDLTGIAVPGEVLTLAVRLIRRHEWVQMDMPRHALEFCGLWQSATLYALEPCYVCDYHLVTELAPDLSMGEVYGRVLLHNRLADGVDGMLTAQLRDSGGALVSESCTPFAADAESSLEIQVEVEAQKPALWNDEFPNLYTLRLELAVPGQNVQCVSWRTGFRRLELSPEGPRLNGRPVKFRGVNHLTFHPQGGLHTPTEWLRQTLRMMKRGNVNAIRTHFCGPRPLADLCDEMGVYLVQELPLDWGRDYLHRAESVGPALTRIEGAVRRDRHHASVMAWAVGNENLPESEAAAEDGWRHLRICDAFCKTLDPERPTIFPPPGPDGAMPGRLELCIGDVADIHYSLAPVRRFAAAGAIENPRSWAGELETITRSEALNRGWSGVWFSSEYGAFNAVPDLLNAPYCSVHDDDPPDPAAGGNSLKVFADRVRREWGLMRDDPTCLGGAYFPWICAGAGQDGPHGNPWGWVRWAADADWGVVTADLLPKPQFWALRVLYSPVWFPDRMVWKPGQEALTVRVANQFNAIDLKDCTLRIQMNGGTNSLGTMRRFEDVPMQCAPGHTTEIQIPLWDAGTLAALQAGGVAVVRCTLLKPDGFRVLTHDIVVVPKGYAGGRADTAISIAADGAAES